jgi:uncharacterized protein GlcG (DUF336 family)
MSTIKLSKANSIIRSVFKKSSKLDLVPLAAVVLDAGGHVKAMQSQDGAGFLKTQIAQAKAYGSLGMGKNSRDLNKYADERPHHASAMNTISNGHYMPVAGGVIIRNKTGQVVGAIGVSGAHCDDDEKCAVWAIKHCGFTTG